MLYDAEHDTIASHEGLLDRTILLDGFSKTFAMTGWRLGYAALPRAARRADRPADDQLRLVHGAGDPARRGRRAHGPARRGQRDAGRVPPAPRRVVAGLNELPGRVLRDAARAPSTRSRTSPAPGIAAKELADRLLAEAGVAVLAGTAFGAYGEGYLRLSYANSLENIAGGARGDRHAARATRRRLSRQPHRRHAPDPAAGARPAGRAGDELGLAARPAAGHRRAARRDCRRRRRGLAAARPGRRRLPRRRRPAAAGRRRTSPSATTTSTSPACAAAGVIVTNTPGVLTEATADIAFALILMATRRLGEGERLIRTGKPWSWNMFFLLGTGIQGKTLGIVGLGQIGTAVARRGRAFGMEIVYTRPPPGRRRRRSGARGRATCRSTSCSPPPTSSHCTAL